MSPLRRASKEELRAGTLPAPHTGFSNALDAVLYARLRFTGDVECVDAWSVIFCGTDGETYNCFTTVML
jgi:hypothetical protein